MNAANLTKSKRLQRVEKFLSDGLFHSTRDIRCIRRVDVWRYRMIGKREAA